MRFTTFVIIPAKANLKLEDVQAYVDLAMSPYDQNLEVPKYREDCYCLGREAFNAAVASGEATIGQSFSSFIADFLARITEEDLEREEVIEEFKKTQSKYRDAFTATWDSHSLKNKPNAKCPECKGKGSVELTLNKSGKWSSYIFDNLWDYEACFREDFVESIENSVINVDTYLQNWAKFEPPDALVIDGVWFDEEGLEYTDEIKKHSNGLLVCLNCRRSP